MRARFYVGCLSHADKWEVFKSNTTPTEENFGTKYAAVIGPFRTKRGAVFMVEHGYNNPHVRDVRDAERIAKKLAS